MGAELFFINLVTALCVTFFMVLVVRNGLANALSKRFFAFLLSLLAWLIVNYLSNQTVLPDIALLWINKLVFVAAIIAVATMMRFCFTINNEYIPRQVDIATIILTLIACALSVGPYVVESITARDSVVGIEFGWGAGVYFAFLGLFACTVVATLVRNAIKSKGVARARARVLTAGFGAGLLLVAVTNVILPALFDAFYLSAIGSLVVVSILVGVGYSIVKYQLFDVRLFVARSLAYVFALAVFVLAYAVITFGLLSRFTNQSVSLAHELPYFATALFLGFTVWPIKKYFDRVSDKIFYKDNYNVQDVLKQFSNLILGEVRLSSLTNGTLRLIESSIKPAGAQLVLIDSKGRITEGSHTTQKRQDLTLLIEALMKSREDILLADSEELEGERKGKALSGTYNSMKALDIQVVARLKTPSTPFIGYILLGHKQSGSIYTDQDVRLLGLISSELAVATENSLRFEEIRNFNETLQVKVDSATQRLRRANEQLQKLDEAKDEFVSMASHQLRTPLTSVKGYISMVLEGDAGKITATQRRLLGEAYTSSERMVHLINDFLNVSRLQTGKFMLEQRPVDLCKVVEQEVESLQTTAKAHDLALKFRKPSYFPILYIDEGKLRQVLMNFIDNAIYYSHEGTTIDVKLEVIEGDVVLTVHDTGIGVPKAEQAHLFSKFFRATNARKQRPDGTGVGLFLAKKVVDAHGGSMVFESVEGEGSTFGFRLPIKKLSSAPKDNPDELNK